ncbi:chondroitin synthase [Arthrobacter sp. Hiyo4]|nr:chondroitin synthase [Arthrobacter sp. Hiyo4]
MSPKVSIVIPAYNNVQYIEETLQSVLNQSFDDYEVVIADHSSIDGTAEVIARFADHPKVRVLPPHPLAAVRRRTGTVSARRQRVNTSNSFAAMT